MNAGRSARITLLVAEQAAIRGARVGVADALAFADAAALVLLDTRIEETEELAARSADGPPWEGHLADLGGHRAEIDQATGMLTVQLGVGVEEALVRLRAHAYAHGRRLAEVAADVVAHRLRIPPDRDTEGGKGR